MLKSKVDNSTLTSTKRRKKVSKVWEDFNKITEDDGTDWALCNHCGRKFVGSSKSGTTHLRNHLERCPNRRNGDGGEDEINEADINEVGIIVRHGGRWSNSEDNYQYVGGTASGMFISNITTYTELKARLCKKLKIEPDKTDIAMKFLCPAEGPTPPVELGDDEDVRFFVKENSVDVRVKYPLCVQSIGCSISPETDPGSSSETNGRSKADPGSSTVNLSNLSHYGKYRGRKANADQ